MAAQEKADGTRRGEEAYQTEIRDRATTKPQPVSTSRRLQDIFSDSLENYVKEQ